MLQGLGLVLTPAVAWVILWVDWIDANLYWRCVLGFGALPGLILVWLRVLPIPKVSEKISTIRTHAARCTCKRLGSILRQLEYALRQPGTVIKLLGTGGCWFIQDLTFYGNVIIQGTLLETIFGKQEHHMTLMTQEMFVALIALPGCFVAVLLMDTLGPKLIQMQGFLVCGCIYIALSYYLDQWLATGQKMLLMVLYSTFVPAIQTMLFGNNQI